MESTPVDATKLTFSSKTLIAIVVAAVTVVSSQWLSYSSLKSEMQKAVTESMTAQDAKFAAQEKSIDDLRKEFRLLQLNVTDYMINNKRRVGQP